MRCQRRRAHTDKPPHTSPGHCPSAPSCHQHCPSAIAHHHTTGTVMTPTQMPPTLPPIPSPQRGHDADAMTHTVPTTPTDAVATLLLHPYQRGAGLSPSPHLRHRWWCHTLAVPPRQHADGVATPSLSPHHLLEVATRRRRNAVSMLSPCHRRYCCQSRLRTVSALSKRGRHAAVTAMPTQSPSPRAHHLAAPRMPMLHAMLTYLAADAVASPILRIYPAPPP